MARGSIGFEPNYKVEKKQKEGYTKEQIRQMNLDRIKESRKCEFCSGTIPEDRNTNSRFCCDPCKWRFHNKSKNIAVSSSEQIKTTRHKSTYANQFSLERILELRRFRNVE